MRTVYSIRIDKRLREEMEKYDVEWGKEIEEFIRKRIEELRREEELKKIDEMLKEVPHTKPTGTKLVREDREGR
ncbi:MAG: hypothetical protein ACP5HQ_05560 [Thermoprotei archaeon]